MLEGPDAAIPKQVDDAQRHQQLQQRKATRHKPVPFRKEILLAQQRQTEKEERIKTVEEGKRQKQEKLEQRERFRKAMAKARSGGKNGQRKLGRESKVLLEKVQRMMNE